MAIVFEAGAPSPEHTAPASSLADHDVVRGRRRDRSQTRASSSSVRADESSTLRGRSRRRASSPLGQPSRSSTPSLMSPTRQLLIHNRLRETRREHCPSRKQSPTRHAVLQRRRQRSRSRSRGFRADMESHRAIDHLSGLRHEVLADGGSTAQANTDTQIS